MRENRYGKLAALTVLLLTVLLLSGCAGKADPAKTVVIMDHTEAEMSPRENAALDESSWYGWWKMVDTSGDWAHMHGYWWDCCAQFSEDGSLVIWDEDVPKSDGLAVLGVAEDETGFAVTGGTFMGKAIEQDAVTMEMAEDKNGRVLTITGRCTLENSKGSFRFEMVMRPWGAIWQCAADELPYYYTDWYLPLIGSGKAMPDTIGN